MLRFTAALLCYLILSGPTFASEEVDTAIVFVVDVSDSMSTDEVHFTRDAHAAALVSQPVQEALRDSLTGRIAAAYVEYAIGAQVAVEWTIIDGAASALDFGNRIEATPLEDEPATYGTNMGPGLERAARLFDRLPYRAARRIVDVVGDGKAKDEPATRIWRDELLVRGVIINGLPLMTAPAEPDVADWFAATLVGGPGHFSWPLTDIREMPNALRQKILLELY